MTVEQSRQQVNRRGENSIKKEFVVFGSFANSHMVNSTWKCNFRSANGANCNSQGQVLSAAKRVAPG